MTIDSPILVADELALRTRRGHVFGPIDLTLCAGDLAMLVGPAGTGKTALLLALGARMRPTSGSLLLGGIDARIHPERARRRAAFGLVPGVNDLAGSLTVRDTIRRELAFAGKSPAETSIVRVLSPLGSSIDPSARVGALTAGQRAELGVALALTADPALLLVDAIDADLSPEECARLVALLGTVAERGLAVVGSCVDPATARTATVVVSMVATSEGEVNRDAVA